jgi:membrane associated rhomboid family serine protease
LISFIELGRLITYQFLHADIWHLTYNMLGLYFFGTTLEQHWGGKRLLGFYLFCGIVGGILFLLLAPHVAGFPLLIGASGAVLGLLAACAYLFPGMVIILILFPVPIRFAAILLVSLYGLNTLATRNLSDACHLGGMLGGFLFVVMGPFWQRFTYERNKLRRQALIDQEEDDQKVVDKILEKVHKHGIQSLNWREKRTLQKITLRQKMRDDLRKKTW